MTISKTPMTLDAASKIQSKEARANNGKIIKGGFAARALKAAYTNKNNGVI